MTYLNSVPSAHVNTYRRILVRHTSTSPVETWRLNRPKIVNRTQYPFVHCLCVRIGRLVDGDIGDRRLDARPWPRQGHVEVTHGSSRQRLASLDELGVQWICHESSHVCARLPNCGGKTVTWSSSGSKAGGSCRLTKDPVNFVGLLHGRAPVLPLHAPLSASGS